MPDSIIKAIIVIPSLEPGDRLLQLLEKLHESLNEQSNSNIHAKILILNDGSSPEYDTLFEQAKVRYDCILLKHAINLGKGRALKTAFNYYLNEFPDYNGIVTADSDGQHSAADIIKCINELSGTGSLILGCRDFNAKGIPKKNRIGNKLTRAIFSFLCGVKISDTQTGLRAIHTELIKEMITVPGERFEYEMNMLVECGNKKIPIKEVPIETIYLDNNASSHFNPVLDSIRIYKTFIKYILSAISSFLLDIAVFAVIVFATKEFSVQYILISTVIARVISSFYNYMVNRNIVFSGNKRRNTFVKYYILAAFIMLSSGFFTTLLHDFTILNEVPSKILVDTVLFLLSYYVQKKWIF